MVGTFPQYNLSQQIPIATHNQDMTSSPAGINNQDMDSNPGDINNLVGISNPADINSPVDISRDHMEHLPMGPRVL